MSMAKAVVASNCGGHQELIEHGKDGWLYEAGNRESLENALCRVAGDQALRDTLASSARRFVLEERNWHLVAKPYLALYERLRRRPEC
jgi:glycosyltransferase involved in cell wall biosynthesis